jgi:hypothetical protein
MKKYTRNRDVVAPKQCYPTILDLVTEYLQPIGFSPCGLVRRWASFAFRRLVPDTDNRYLYLLLNGQQVRIYQGVRTGTPDAGVKISAHRLYHCTVHELEDTLTRLAETNFL